MPSNSSITTDSSHHAGHGISARVRDDMSLDRIREALRALRFGTVTITVHDGVVVQVDRTERIRLDR
jgi:hypothetical protein